MFCLRATLHQPIRQVPKITQSLRRLATTQNTIVIDEKALLSNPNINTQVILNGETLKAAYIKNDNAELEKILLLLGVENKPNNTILLYKDLTETGFLYEDVFWFVKNIFYILVSIIALIMAILVTLLAIYFSISIMYRL